MRFAVGHTSSAAYEAECAYFAARARGDREAMERHARAAFGASRGRANPTPARPGSLLDTMQKLSARCRKLAAECDRERVANVLAGRIGRAHPKQPVCPWCGQPDDEFNGCFCGD
jgi:hypothetical protein